MGNSVSPQKPVTTFFCNRVNGRKVPEGLWEKGDPTRRHIHKIAFKVLLVQALSAMMRTEADPSLSLCS